MKKYIIHGESDIFLASEILNRSGGKGIKCVMASLNCFYQILKRYDSFIKLLICITTMLKCGIAFVLLFLLIFRGGYEILNLYQKENYVTSTMEINSYSSFT